MSLPRSRRDPIRVRGAALVVAGLLVMAPMIPAGSRALGEPRLDKESLFTAAVDDAFDQLREGVAVGSERVRDQLAANGGWTGGRMPWLGSGTFSVVAGTTAAPAPERRTVQVLVRVEEGIPIDPVTFADGVMAILNDPRGWGPIDGVAFARTDVDAAAEIVITIASPGTTEVLCGELPTRGFTSCGRGRPVNINGDRWLEAAPAFLSAGGTVAEYRNYVINHEVGHSLNHGHETCAAPGRPAPVMMQQTLGLGECLPSGWPSP